MNQISGIAESTATRDKDMNQQPALMPLNIALLTVSDTRDLEQDRSGQLLAERIQTTGHHLFARQIVTDDVYKIRAVLSQWIADDHVQTVVITGGTGVTARDVTPEAIKPLLDKPIEGFGELFRMLSFDEVGTSTMQSRAVAGIANATFIFCIPGSPNACQLAWDKLLVEQLDNRNKPCNFSQLLPRIKSGS